MSRYHEEKRLIQLFLMNTDDTCHERRAFWIHGRGRLRERKVKKKKNKRDKVDKKESI